MNDKKNQSLSERREQVKELLHFFARGEREIAAGTGYDLDTMLAEADALLAEELIPKDPPYMPHHGDRGLPHCK